MALRKIQHNESWIEIEVNIDDDHPEVDQKIKEMVEFWGGWEQRLEHEGGNYRELFLKQLAVQIYPMIISGEYFQSVIDHFNDLEGWVPMDGSHGIEIVGYEPCPIHESDFDVVT